MHAKEYTMIQVKMSKKFDFYFAVLILRKLIKSLALLCFQAISRVLYVRIGKTVPVCTVLINPFWKFLRSHIFFLLFNYLNGQ